MEKQFSNMTNMHSSAFRFELLIWLKWHQMWQICSIWWQPGQIGGEIWEAWFTDETSDLSSQILSSQKKRRILHINPQNKEEETLYLSSGMNITSREIY